MKPKLNAESIAALNSEELFGAINNLFPQDDPEIANNCLLRFFELIQEDIGTDSSTIDEEGRITVDMRVVEPHLFAKTMNALAMNTDLYFQCEAI
jgi:hypothetical protein